MSFRRSTIVSTAVAVVSTVIMLIVTIVNVNGLTASLKRRTYSYLRDVSEQSAQVIEQRFTGLLNSLEIMGNSLAYAAVVDDEEFLKRKLPTTMFEAMTYVRLDGTAIMVSEDGTTHALKNVIDSFADSDALEQAMQGRATAGLFDDKIAFMQPIGPTNSPSPDEVVGVMIGIRSKDKLQQLLVNDAFGGSGFTFILDQYDEIVAQPMDEEDYEMLSKLIHDTLPNAAVRITDNEVPPSGSDWEEFTLQAGKTTLLLDAQPLDEFDWIVVTAVDETFLSEAVNKYVIRIIVTLIILFIIFVVLLFMMLYMQRKYQRRIEAVAFVDTLTGGMSFIRFRMLAEPLIAKSEEGEYALVTLNVKRFKLINRLGGSREGDEVLRKIYNVILKNLRGQDEIVAHGTADNFTILLHNESEDELRRRLEKLSREIENLQTVMPVRISMGVYEMTDPNIDIIMFLDRSNMARVSAPQDYHSTVVFYDDDFVEKQEERLRMIAMIEDGLKNDEFTVYLQPKISPSEDKMMGSEALVRWEHPTRGMIGPNLFIPLCEQNGLIVDLDMYVFEKVCRQLREWIDKGWDPTPVSVNVSGMHLKDADFVKKYREIVDKYELDPSLLELELTESIMFSDFEVMEAKSVIDTIHDYGFRCSMDDFGSGYSALGLLTDLPIDCIKLDRSFFLDFVGNERAQTVVQTVIQLAKDLDITTVAEGIETKEQVEILKNMGVDMIQGFYYSRPLPIKQFADMAFIRHSIFDKDDKKD